MVACLMLPFRIRQPSGVGNQLSMTSAPPGFGVAMESFLIQPLLGAGKILVPEVWRVRVDA